VSKSILPTKTGEKPGKPAKTRV